MKRSIRPLLAVALLSPAALWAQGSPLLTVEQPEKVVAKRNTSVHAGIRVSLQNGYHVNSNKPSEDYLIPLRLTWTPGILESTGVVYPQPQMEKYEFSPKPLSVFTGNFELTASFKVPAGAPVGPGMMLGKLRYQACNNKACFPPKTVEVKMPVEVH